MGLSPTGKRRLYTAHTRSRRSPTAAFGEATFAQLSGNCCSYAIAYGGAGMLSNTFAVVIRDVSIA